MHRGRQMLDVGDLDHRGIGVDLDPDRPRSELALDPPGDDLVLAQILGRVQQLLPEVVVDGGIGAAADRAGERYGGDTGAAAAEQELGAGAEEGALGGSDAEAEAGREQVAQGAEGDRRIVRGRSLDRDLAREHDLLELAGADSLDRPGDPALVGARRGDARDRGLAARARVEHRQRLLADRGDPATEAREDRLAIGATGRDRVHGQPGPAAGSQQGELGQHQQARRERRPGRPRAAVRGEREAPGPDRAGAGGESLGLVGEPPAHHPRGLAGDVVEAAGPARDRLVGRAQGREREPVAVRLLPAEPAVVGHPRGEGGGRRIGDVDLGRDRDQVAARRRSVEDPLEPRKQIRDSDHRLRGYPAGAAIAAGASALDGTW